LVPQFCPLKEGSLNTKDLQERRKAFRFVEGGVHKQNIAHEFYGNKFIEI
jgi:hypothetical protein